MAWPANHAMSRVLKNFIRYISRARWKQLAPRRRVLSTSKNAQAGEGGIASTIRGAYGCPMTIPSSGDVRLLLVERAGCHLCADAHAVMDAVTKATGQPWVSVDVDASDPLLEAFGELVPVALVDGDPRGHWRLDAATIIRALDGGTRAGS